MKRKFLTAVLSFALVTTFFTFQDKYVANAGANEMSAPLQRYASENNNVDAFYTSSNAGSVEGLKDDALLEQLAKIMSEKHRYYTSYGDVRGAMAYSDEDPNDPKRLIAFYAGVSIPNAWNSGSLYNREHVWCKSLSGGLFPNVSNGDTSAGADIHQLRPSIQTVNSTRGNKLYADLNKKGTEIKYSNEGTGCYYSGDGFEPRDGIKGDVARILMYMYTHYSTEVSNSTSGKNGNLKITNIVSTSSNTTQAAWDLLLKWNAIDPVDDFEMNRNNYCASITGVRNPYIDHPEFANMIWDTSYTGNGALVDNSVFTLNVSEVSLQIGETHKIEIIGGNPTDTYTYTIENDYVANVSSTGLVTALNVGTTNVIVSNGISSKKLVVNVIDSNQEFEVNFYLNDGTTNKYGNYSTTVKYGDLVTKPSVDPKRDGYEFAYWAKDGKKYDFASTVTSNIDLYATWQSSNTYTMITSKDDLVIGGKYLVVALNNNKAMGTEQRSNNRASVNIVKNSDGTINYDDSIQIVELKEGMLSNSYALSVSGQYLYAAGGSSNNYLRTQDSLTAEASFNIDISANGKANIVCANSSVSRGILRYNSSADIFACYQAGNAQLDVCLYKLNEVEIEPEPEKEFSLNMYAQIKFTAKYNDDKYYDLKNFCLTVSGTYTDDTLIDNPNNFTFGYALAQTTDLISGDYESFADMFKDYTGDIKESPYVESCNISEDTLSVEITDVTDFNKEISIAFYAYSIIDNKYYFAETKNFTYKSIANLYLSNESLLDSYEDKNAILDVLKQI